MLHLWQGRNFETRGNNLGHLNRLAARPGFMLHLIGQLAVGYTSSEGSPSIVITSSQDHPSIVITSSQHPPSIVFTVGFDE
jgi:hypothetical protein